jgi:hypothetical protein
MSTRLREKRVWTIREAARIFPFIARKTILAWVTEDIFHPIILAHGPVTPTQGSKLDFWDLVTVGVLHQLLAAGLRFKHLRLQGQRFETADLKFQKSVPAEVMDNLKHLPRDEARHHFLDAVDYEQVDSLRGRILQRYLKTHGGAVMVFLRFKRPIDLGIPTNQLVFYAGSGGGSPATQEVAEVVFIPLPHYEYYSWSMLSDPSAGRHTFINCLDKSKFVQERLDALS